MSLYKCFWQTNKQTDTVFFSLKDKEAGDMQKKDTFKKVKFI